MYPLHIKKISAGYDYTMLLTGKNQLMTFGNNNLYQLGFFSPSSSFKDLLSACVSSPVRKPTIVKTPKNETIIEIAATRTRSYFLTEKKNIYVCGDGYNNLLHNGFTRINNEKLKFEHIYSRHDGVLLTDTEGNKYEIIFFYAASDCLTTSFKKLKNQKNYEQAGNYELKSMPTLTSVRLGIEHALSLRKKDNAVYVNGANTYGQLGMGIAKNMFVKANNCQKIPNLKDIAKICAGPYNSFAINGKGKVYAFGRNDSGQLGLRHKKNQFTPTLIQKLDNIIDIIPGYYHTFFINNLGDVFGCGNNSCGQLLLPKNIKYATTPRIIKQLKYPLELQKL